MISAQDLAWAAGFVDGDGYIRFEPKRSGRGRGLPRIVVTQDERGPLEHLRALFPGSKTYGAYPQTHHPCDGVHCIGHPRGHPPCKGVGCKHAKVYHWRANGQRALLIMRMLFPLSHHKGRKTQIREVLAKCKRKIPRCPKGHPYVFVVQENPPPCRTHDIHFLHTCPKCGSTEGAVGFPRLALRCKAP